MITCTKQKTISCSLAGPSKDADGRTCEDAHMYCEVENDWGTVFVSVVADGAGSVRFGRHGAELICNAIRQQTTERFQSPSSINEKLLRRWIEEAREQLVREANQANYPLQEFATTCVLCVSVGTLTWFAQIGDGGIVVKKGNVYGVVFQPQHGRYINETCFITEQQWQEKLQLTTISGDLAAILMFSDGCEDVFLRDGGTIVNTELTSKVVSHFQAHGSNEHADLKSFLEMLGEFSDDDKTLLVRIS